MLDCGGSTQFSIELGDSWSETGPNKQLPWQDEGVKYLLISRSGNTRGGFAVVDEASEEVVGLVGPDLYSDRLHLTPAG